MLKYHQRLSHWLHFVFLIGIVWLYSEHSHHWQPSDHISLQRYHQTRHNQETAWRRPTFPKKSVSTWGFDSGVPGALPRQNTTPVQRDHQTAPTTVLEEVQWIHCMLTFFKHTVFPQKTDAEFEEGQICHKDQRLIWYFVTFYLIYYYFLWTCGTLIFWGFWSSLCLCRGSWLSTMILFLEMYFLLFSLNVFYSLLSTCWRQTLTRKTEWLIWLDGRLIFLVQWWIRG